MTLLAAAAGASASADGPTCYSRLTNEWICRQYVEDFRPEIQHATLEHLQITALSVLLGLVLLEDDKGIQPAQNLTPAVNADFLADNPDLEDVFNELSAALTTEDLAAMNVKVDLERQKPEDVAKAFLEDKGLI